MPEPASAITGTVLGFDFGELRIGTAVGQTVTGSATPLEVLNNPHRGRPDWEGIARLIEEWAPRALVVGIPCLDDGTEYPIARRIHRFARQLHGRFHLPVFEADERLSSVEGAQRLGRHDGPVDHAAAAVILETWLGSR